MNLIRRVLRTEPILFARVITSVAALAVAFGVNIPDADVNAAVDGVLQLLALGNIALGFLERQAVFSRKTHEQEVAATATEANEQGAGTGYLTGMFDADAAGAAAFAYQSGFDDGFEKGRRPESVDPAA